MKAYAILHYPDDSPIIGQVASLRLSSYSKLISNNALGGGETTSSTDQNGKVSFDVIANCCFIGTPLYIFEIPGIYQTYVNFNLPYSEELCSPPNFTIAGLAEQNIFGTATGTNATKQVKVQLSSGSGSPIRTTISVGLARPQVDVRAYLILGEVKRQTNSRGIATFNLLPCDKINNAVYYISFLDKTYYFSFSSADEEPINLGFEVNL